MSHGIDPGKCIEKGCQAPREASTWYCVKHNQEWRNHVSKRKDGNTSSVTTGPYLDSYLGKEGTRTKGNVTITDHDSKPTGKIWVPSCVHRGLEPVLTLKDGRQLYAAQGGSLTRRDHLDLIIDCAGLVRGHEPFVKGKARWRSLNVLTGPEMIRLDWPDMTAPVHVGLRFWQRLLEMLPQKTCVCCVGSHGRTGTALAALLIAEGMESDQAIVTVRQKHCHKAIETVEQEKYLKGLRP